MLGENPNNNEGGTDEEFEKAKKSMAGRVDQDDEVKAPVVEPTPPQDDPEKDVPDAPVVVDTPKVEEKPEEMPPKKVDRPQAYIPMPKYLSEKEENARVMAEKDAKIAEALQQVEELKALATQKDGDNKDKDIEEFMDKTGFSRDTVEGLLALAEKRILKPEYMKSLDTTTAVVKEAEMEAAYNQEFDSVAVPELKKQFPTITVEAMEKIKDLLDQVAHTPGFNDKSLDFIIYKKQDEIKAIAGEVPAVEEVETPGKKTIESSRIGSGKITSLTAKDFEGKTDFTELESMDSSERSLLIKDMPLKTYENFMTWVKQKDQGVEVTRDGKKVMLK